MIELEQTIVLQQLNKIQNFVADQPEFAITKNMIVKQEKLLNYVN
jgi:hypothetical protein